MALKIIPFLRPKQTHSFFIRLLRKKAPQASPKEDDDISCPMIPEQQPDVITKEFPSGKRALLKFKKGILILNRPYFHNMLNNCMVHILLDTLTKWEDEKNMIIIKGAGHKAFCGGADLKELIVAYKAGNKALVQDFLKTLYQLAFLIATYRRPYLAIMDGEVTGSGAAIAVLSSFRIATERTVFSMPVNRLGYFPDAGIGSYFLPQLGRLGTYLALTGYPLVGEDNLCTSVANYFVHSSCLKEMERALLQCESARAIREILKKYDASTGKEFGLKRVMGKIDKCFGKNSIEEIIEALKEEGTNWGKEQIRVMSHMSPTSLKLALKQIRSARGKELDDCLKIEYKVANGCYRNHDFYEGVRARLIDKDDRPIWCPPTLEQVNINILDTYFQELPKEEQLIFIPH